MTLRRLLGAIALSFCACYSAGDGTAPPDKNFYFPVGLAVSRGGNVLYVVNSDFDLQWNGGTLQSYDLHLIRRHAVLTRDDPSNPELTAVILDGRQPAEGDCPSEPPLYRGDKSGRAQPPGETCSPPFDSQFYVRDSAIIGAFATDLQIVSRDTIDEKGQHHPGVSRLFAPVRGDASLTWADLVPDEPSLAPDKDNKSVDAYPAFRIACGDRTENRCDVRHHAGSDPNEPGNTRHLTMPGEPFGMAVSEDGSAIVITHQTDTKASLLTTGIPPGGGNQNVVWPALQFVADGLPTGGNGIAAVPHDQDAFLACDKNTGVSCAPRPAFLLTSRTTPEVDLLRYYSDQGFGSPGVDNAGQPNPPLTSSLLRPFILKEGAFPLSVNAGGADSRGIVIDPTPRLACKLGVRPADPAAKRTDADVTADQAACARLPARVFIANRTPASLLLGEIGEPSLAGDGGYDADRLVIFGNTPLSVGPSRLYLAPVVDADGTYALRVFIVCFDSATIFVYDPDAGQVENIIHVGLGPFAMAFDPFDLNDVAARKRVPADPRDSDLDLKAYRFAYVASFTNSFVQVIDLDNSRADKSSFERIVMTLGSPTPPKGSP